MWCLHERMKCPTDSPLSIVVSVELFVEQFDGHINGLYAKLSMFNISDNPSFVYTGALSVGQSVRVNVT
jgi:hypothetical protein